MHLKTHIFTCDAHHASHHLCVYTSVHVCVCVCVYVSVPVGLPSRFEPPTQVPDPSCVYRKQILLMNSDCGQTPPY